MYEITLLLMKNSLLVAGFMFLVWLLSLMLKDASIADIFWGPGFVLVAGSTFYMAWNGIPRQLLLAVLVTLWGLRLFLHIFFRNRGRGEDPRYVKMREKHGKRFWIVSLFTVFLFQGFLLLIISSGFQYGIAAAGPAGLSFFDYAGVALWLVGFFFEGVGDWQLKRFLADPGNRGRVMDRGLWGLTRHPNYFGEAVMWWGIFIIVLPLPLGWMTCISPFLITFLLLRVSGVTMLERHMMEENPAYARYVKEVSSFLPLGRRKVN